MNSNFWGRCKPPPGATLDRSHPIAQNLELWHLSNEGAGQLITDLSGHGTVRRGVQTAATTGLWVPGTLGPSLNFNGTTNYVLVGDVIAGSPATGTHGMPVTAQQPWTISFWVRIATNATGGACLAANGANGATTGYQWEVMWSNSYTNVIRYQSAGPSTVAAGIWDGNGTAVPLNRYTHITITDDGKMATGSLAFWMNGAKITGSQTQVPNPTTKSTFEGIATWGGSPASEFGTFHTGRMDNPMIWSRVLPDTMIRDLYSEPFAALAPPVWRRYFVPSTQSAVVARQVVARGVDRGVAWGVR